MKINFNLIPSASADVSTVSAARGRHRCRHEEQHDPRAELAAGAVRHGTIQPISAARLTRQNPADQSRLHHHQSP